MLEFLKSIYNGKRVLLTGHTGFKGSWMLKMFDILGAEVMGYALEPLTNDDLYYQLNGDTLCTSVIGDLLDKDLLEKSVTSFQPDFIFHLAAQPLVRLSYEKPAETFAVNAIGTANVLSAMLLLEKPCCAVMITTDKVYDNKEWEHPYRESDRLGGYDPYSASKACAELVIDSYRNSFFNIKTFAAHQKAVAVGRAGNVIGGGDWSKDRLLPDIARSMGKKEPVIIRNPVSVRPWQHVLEPLAGYLLLGAKLSASPAEFSKAYNFGPETGDTLSVLEMADLFLATWGEGSYLVREPENAPHEAGLLKLDISRAKDKLNWKPLMNAAAAVTLTVEWYKHFYADKATIPQMTTAQIMKFMTTGA